MHLAQFFVSVCVPRVGSRQASLNNAPVSQRSWVHIPYGPEIYFFQVLFTTTSFSSVLSCEDLLISSLHRSANT